VEIEGTFDPAAASIVCLELTRSRPTKSVVLDFSHARAAHDLGLAMVARALAAEGVPARFRGISHHQERMLQYLGLAAACQQAVGVEPELNT
jgi:hypothetical protein